MSKLNQSTVEKVKEALKKDFEVLYQKEFTTDWRAQRIIRELEINVMGLTNLEKAISQSVLEEREKIKTKITTMKKKRLDSPRSFGDGNIVDVSSGYNQAIDDILSTLSHKEKK